MCPEDSWDTSLLPRIAPTASDDESRADPGKNPNFDHLLRGTVHDPTARRMGGVAGHAGVFSTAHDVSLFAQALLDRLAGRPSRFPLRQATLELMTTPQQPGHTAGQVEAANDALREAAATTPNTDVRCSLRTIRRSRDKSCAASAGISIRPFQAARQDLPDRELRPHWLHRNLAVAGPRLRYLRHPAHERNPYARQSTDVASGGRSGDRGGPGTEPLQQLVIGRGPIIDVPAARCRVRPNRQAQCLILVPTC